MHEPRATVAVQSGGPTYACRGLERTVPSKIEVQRIAEFEPFFVCEELTELAVAICNLGQYVSLAWRICLSHDMVRKAERPRDDRDSERRKNDRTQRRLIENQNQALPTVS